MKNIFQKIEQANLVGRGGANFSTAAKWEMVKNAKGEKKYVVCNASEGEPGVRKDRYILENHAGRVVDGMLVALEYLWADEGYLYLNHDYQDLRRKLDEAIGEHDFIKVFFKPESAGYIGGEESGCLNVLEGKRAEPRLKPPFPPTCGLWGQPTLINNVETFYDVSLVKSGEYKYSRFYTIDGDCVWHGVYEYPETATIEEILKKTKNYPDFPFFVQVGGAASGTVLNSKQLKQPAIGAGSIRIYSTAKRDPEKIITEWIEFFYRESCGQCTPCREGTYRLKEVLESGEPDWKLFADLLGNLKESSFCGLGAAAPVAVMSYIENVLSKDKNLSERLKEMVKAVNN